MEIFGIRSTKATVYYGKIEGNRLVFTRHLESFRGLLEDVTPEEMEGSKALYRILSAC